MEDDDDNAVEVFTIITAIMLDVKTAVELKRSFCICIVSLNAECHFDKRKRKLASLLTRHFKENNLKKEKKKILEIK